MLIDYFNVPWIVFIFYIVKLQWLVVREEELSISEQFIKTNSSSGEQQNPSVNFPPPQYKTL